MRKVNPFAHLLIFLAPLVLAANLLLAQEATPTATPTPEATPTPTPTVIGSQLPMPTPSTGDLPVLPDPAITPAVSPTPLPDGTMPWTPPPLPTFTPTDAATLSEQLNTPPVTPQQSTEALLPGAETDKLKTSEDLAMKQKMIMSDFDKSLSGLIAKQRNPNVADMGLTDAVNIALKRNPDILNAIQQIRLTRGQLIQLFSRVVPQLGITSTFTQQAETLAANGRTSGDNTLTIPTTSGPPLILTLGGGNQDIPNQAWNIQFQAQQLIFDGGGAINGIRSGAASYDSAFYALRATVDSIIAQVQTQFYQVVLNRALIVAQEQNVALLQQQVQDQQNRYEAGTVPRFNVLQAEVQLANAKPPLIQAQNNFRVSLYQLVRLLGMDYPAGHPSEVPFNVTGALGFDPRTINTDASIRTAISHNPALKAQRQQILAQAANLQAQYAGYLPTVNANVGYQITNNQGTTDLTQTVEGWFFGATGSWNVFDGGLTYGRVAQAKAQLLQTKNNYDNSVRQVVLNVQTAISNLQQARETIDSTTASVVQATEALRLSRERLDAGAGTQLDVLNAQVQLLQSQTFVLQARFDYIAALASYDQALSLDTQYADTFDDPMTRAERKKFEKLNKDKRPQPKLPGSMRASDPIKPILEGASSRNPKPETKAGKKKSKPSPTPKPTPKKKSGS